MPKPKNGLTEKQKRFIDFYIASGNATDAARKAGYKHPNQQGNENLSKLGIKEAITKRLKKLEDARVADAKEVMQRLTSIARAEEKEDVIVVEGDGDGCSTARIIQKHPSFHDQLDALKALAKRYGLDKPDPAADDNGGGVQIIDDIRQTQ